MSLRIGTGGAMRGDIVFDVGIALDRHLNGTGGASTRTGVSMHGDRRVLWSSFLAVGAATIAVTAAIAQKLPDPMDFGVVYEELAFEAADTDGNNLVSEGEFVRDAAAAFSGLDADRDGKLTPQELGPHDAKSFAEVDANGDGVLTFNEVMTFKMKAFRVADTNQDDALSFDEMVGAVRAEVGK